MLIVDQIFAKFLLIVLWSAFADIEEKFALKPF